MKKIIELFVILENRPSAAGELFRLLKKKNIAIYAIGLFIDTARLYVSDTKKALEILLANDYIVEERQVLQINLPNRTGALMDLAIKLGNAGINIDYLYGALEPQQKIGIIILEVDDMNLTLEIFRNHKF